MAAASPILQEITPNTTLVGLLRWPGRQSLSPAMHNAAFAALGLDWAYVVLPTRPERLGVCLDTCHLLAAGYDICCEEGYAQTFREFDRLVGLDRLKAFHLNDSKKPCGSRVDRHEHIGKGCLGLEPFRRILTDPRFAGLPMLLETPKLDTPESRRRSDIDPWDARNLRTLRRLMRKG